MKLTTFSELADSWRDDAGRFGRRGFGDAQALLESVAEERELAMRRHGDELLTLEQAVNESGYSYAKLQRDVAAGRIPNLGEHGKPMLARRDLPMKPQSQVSDTTSIATSILRGRRARGN